MKPGICLLLMCGLAFAADKAKTPARSSATRAARQAAAVTIPAGAVEIEPGTWRHTGADGKTWLYRKTPFGVARIGENAGKAAPVTPKTDETAAFKAFDDGEFVRFERPGPFGVYKWRSPKAELDATERKVWDRERAKAAANKDRQE